VRWLELNGISLIHIPNRWAQKFFAMNQRKKFFSEMNENAA
jgi:hypothetical protein